MGQTEGTRAAVVTGGGSGIGLATARVLGDEGYRVAVLGRDEGRLRRAAEEIGPSAVWRRADVGDREQVIGAVESMVGELGEIDLLVNNAGFVRGVATGMPIEEAERNFDAEIGANLKGAFLMAMAVVPHLKRPGGRIVNVSSIAAFTGGSRPGTLGYAAAKAGVHGLTYALARELSPQGITVNAVAPGLVAGTRFFGEGGPSEERVEATAAETPVGRAGRPEDIASAVLYLASPQASFVTGEVLSVNGGWLFGR
jgi:3-oxoacyl-[acyl-carrier protein] reductase